MGVGERPTPAADVVPHVVILGGGFGGLFAAKELRGKPVRVTVVDRTNHHLFQPLLYQVALAGLAPSDITVPIRWVLRNEPNATTILAEASAVDVQAKVVRLGDGARLEYDYLIVATGARHSYFGRDDWEPIAPGLKSLDDALEIRRRFLLAYERAERSEDARERDALMTFVIVGGGPTGVELAGMMAEIVRNALPRDFRRIDTRRSRIVLLEGGPRVLPAMPPEVSARAQRDLEALGVEVRTGTLVTAIDATGVTAGGARIATRTVTWAAGNIASPLARTLQAPLDKAGRVVVNPDLSIPGHQEVFVVGDLAALAWKPGVLVPGVAPAAMQEGRHAVRNILRLVRAQPTTPFRYLNKGELATIGRNKAVAVFGSVNVSGFPAWILWLFVHIMYLIGFRNRAIVLLQWGYAYFTFQRGVRLITQRDHGAT